MAEFVATFENFVDDKKIQQSRQGDLVALTTTLLFANVPETLLIAGSSAARANKNEFS